MEVCSEITGAKLLNCSMRVISKTQDIYSFLSFLYGKSELFASGQTFRIPKVRSNRVKSYFCSQTLNQTHPNSAMTGLPYSSIYKLEFKSSHKDFQ